MLPKDTKVNRTAPNVEYNAKLTHTEMQMFCLHEVVSSNV